MDVKTVAKEMEMKKDRLRCKNSHISNTPNRSKILKKLSSALFVGCLMLGAQASYAVEDPKPTLDTLHDSLVNIPGTDEVYPESAYTLNEITPTDLNNLAPNVIKYKASGDTETKYYEVNLKYSVYGEGSSVKYFKWEKNFTGVYLVSTTDPSEAVLTLKYNPDDAIAPIFYEGSEPLSSVNKIYVAQDIQKAINAKTSITSVSSKFAGNTMNISGTNYDYSAVMSGANGTINNVSSSFIGNNVSVERDRTTAVYGTLVKSLGTIDNVYSEFIGNTVSAYNARINGGLIEAPQAGIIKNLTVDAIANKASSQNSNIEGAIIGNSGTITNITGGMYMKNSAASNQGNVYGGVIYNDGKIGNISDTIFSDNFVRSETGTAQGGALYNIRDIDSITNTIFIDNYAQGTSAQGGAIFTDVNLKIYANNGKRTEFTGNYVINNGTKENQAIYINDRNATLTLNATDNGTILFNDAISGVNGYNVVLAGDTTGSIALYNSISNANVSAANVNVNLANNNTFDYNFLSLDSSETAKYSLDIDFANSKADNFTLGSASRGTIYVNDLNIIGSTPTTGKIIQIIKGPDTISLALAEALQTEKVKEVSRVTSYDTVTATASWDDEFFSHTTSHTITEGIRTAITDANRTTADSIEYYYKDETKEIATESMGGTLSLLNEKNGWRNFNAVNAEDVYTVKENLGSTGYTSTNKNDTNVWFKIFGKKDGDVMSTLDANGKTLFELTDVNNGTNLYLEKLNIINLANSDGSFITNNSPYGRVRFLGVNIEGEKGSWGIVNNGLLTVMQASTSSTGIKGTGELQLWDGDLTMTNGASIDQGLITIKGNRNLRLQEGSTIKGQIDLSGRLYIYGEGLLGDFKTFGGELRLIGGTLTKEIANTTGRTIVDGNVTFEAPVHNRIEMSSNATLNTNAENLHYEVFGSSYGSSNNTVNITGGELTNRVNAHNINIYDDVNIGQNGSLNGTLIIREDATLTTNAANLPAVITNNSILNLTGGTLSTAWNAKLDGSGKTVISGYVVANNRPISTAIEILNSGTFNISANNLRSNPINNGILELTGGELNAKVTGDGSIKIVGQVYAKTDVTQDVTINEGAKLTFQHFEWLKNDSITNNGVLTIQNNATIDTNILGKGQLTIDAAIKTLNTYTENSIYVNNATLRTNADNLGGRVINRGRVNLTGGTLRQQIAGETRGQGATYIEGNVISEALISGGELLLVTANNGNLTISADNIDVTNQVNVNGNTNLNLTGGTISSRIGGNGTTNIWGDVTTGEKLLDTNVVIAGDDEHTGTLRSKLNILNRNITNNGNFYASGVLTKNIAGNGTTYIDGELGLTTNAAIQGTLNLNNGILKTDSSLINNYKLGKTTGSGELMFNIDFAKSGMKNDCLTLNSDSDAIFTVSADTINFLNVPSGGISDAVYQVLFGGSSSQLQLGDNTQLNIKIVNDKVDVLDKSDVYYDEDFKRIHQEGIVQGTLSLDTTQTTNDSVKLNIGETIWDDPVTQREPLLAAWNKLITPEERFFRFREADNLYTGLQDMGPTSAGKLNIIGVLDEETGQRSKISLDGKTGFELSNDRILNIYDTEITNVSEYAIKMNGGQVGYLDADGNIEGGLVGVVFSDNTHSSTDTTTSYASVLNISGNSSIIYQIKDSKFINNSNIKSNSDVNSNPSAVAGAIYLEYGSIGTKGTFEGGIINSTFEGNHIIGTGRTNEARGGAISVEYTNAVISNIKDSTFKGNYIEGFNGNIFGGALFVSNQTTIHNIENTLFEGNYLEKAEGLGGVGQGGALYNNGTIDILYNVTFKDNRAAQGGALYNTGTITEITESLFEGNTGLNNAAIWNARNIGSITNTNFIGNTVTNSDHGGIFANNSYNARIGAIEDCIFDGNKISATSEINGAVISNWNNATIDSINNITVKNNVVEANSRVWGLVANGGTINSITNSTFSNNTVNNELRGSLSLRGKTVQNLSGLKFENNISTGGANGVAVYNESTIESFTNSQFIGNKASNNASLGGGAIFNTNNKTINEFRNMVFEENGLISDIGYYAYRWSSGGAIYNEGTFTNGIVNSVFKNNYALMGEGVGMERARGGAICTNKDLRIAAEGEGGLTEFTGNYIGRPNNEDTYLYEAIHVNDKKTLTLDANTGGRILLNDYINGASGYNVVLTGDSDGRISLYNAIKNANVTASSTNIDTADGKIFDYDFLSLNSQDSAGYNIDIDFKNSVADNFTVGENSQGIITIKDLNVLEEADKITTVQIIKAGDSALQLALDSEKINVVDNILLTLNNRAFNTDIFHQNKGFALGTTDTTNDSITMMVDTTYDNLNIIGASTVNADRQFIFNNDETYTVSTDLDDIAAGVFAVKGLEGDQTSATIDANGHSLFNLSNATELQITNTKLTNSASDALQNLITINNEAASVNLKNAYIDGNITGNNQFAININGAGATVITGAIDHADTTLSSGTLTFAQNTFADSNDSLTVNNGNVSLTDSAAKDYQVNKLNSASDASYAIDLDLAAERADKIILTDNTSEGVVKITDINFVNKLDEDKNSFVVQVLDTNHNDKIALELDKFVQTRYDIEDISRIENDEVQQITHFSDKFNSYKRDGILYGDLYLTTTGTENDSIAFEIKEDWENSKELIGSRGDTLRLVNMSELENRTFVSDLATDVYNATDNLGQTHAGTLTINGTEEGDEKSTINLRRYTGFELGADTTLNMNNVQISGNNGVIKVIDNSAEINLNNTNISGNIIGTTEYHINVSGTGTTNLSGLVENGYTTLTKGGLSFDKDTFTHSGSTLDVQSGSVYMNDGNIQTYNFANLVSTDKSKFSIDVDLENSVADGIRVNSGQGTIVLEEFNILGGLTNIDIDKDYTIKILHTPNSNIQLDLSETVKSQIREDIKLGTDHIILDTDEVIPDTLWTDKYWMTEQDLDIWGRLGLYSKDTENDSLHLYHLSIVAGETKRVLGDTLKLWSQAELDEDRTFTFETADNRYEVSEYLGTTSAGKLSIIGAADVDSDGSDKLSVIDMNRKTGFGLSNETELTIKNVEFENVSYRDGCIVNVSNPDAVLNLDNVKILDTTSGNAITNAGTINMTGGKVVLDTGIVGSGITNITGSDLIFGNNISITQQNINVTRGSLTMSDTGIINGKLSIDTDGTVSVRTEGLTGSVNNNGNIILRGGELVQNITGESGKTTILGEIINSAKIAQDVDIKNSGKLTSSAEKLGGEINNNGELVINGELSKFVTGTGTTYVNETLIMDKGSGMSGTLELNDGNISTRDNSVNDYNIGSMQGSGSFTIDIDTQNLTADKFIVGNDSEGTVYIDSVNFLNIDGINEDFKVQILDTNGTDALQLALNSEISSVDYKVKRTVRSEVDDINAITKYSDIYNKYLRGGDVFGNIVLGTTDTTNDSLVVSLDYSKTKWDETRETDGLLGDTLTLWNQLEDENDKKFYFDDVKTYKVGSEFETEGLGITKGENVSITGVSADETKKSTINLNNKTGFELAEATKFTLSDIKLTGNQTLIDVTNNDASITLQNAYIDGNITGSESYKVEISGSDTTTLNGILNNADTELKSGTLKFNTDTFEAENDTLTTTAGNVALNDGQVKDYNINTLESNADANYFIDVNLTDKVADTLHVTHGNGTVTLDKLNITGSADITNQDYKIRILYVDSDSLQLALSDNAQSELGNDEYLIGQSNSIIDDEIKSVTNWKDIYNRYSQDHFTYGKLSLTQTVTTNDSIGIHVTRIEDGELVFVENLGDTLRVVNNDETNETKTFEFDSSSDEYKVKEDLGQTKGTVNIEGVSDGEKSSIIDFDGHSGFELDENSKLNIKNTELSNAHGEQGSVINALVPGKDIDLTNVKITNNSSDGEHGGAIYSNSNVNIHADNDISTVSGNSSASSDEAIYMGEKTTLTLDSKNDGTIIINDKINGDSGYKVHVTGDNSSDVYLNNKVENGILSLDTTTLHLSSDDNLKTSDVVINSGRLDLINNAAQQQVANSFYVNGTFTLDVDVDLANQIMDRLPENTHINPDAFINVDRINLLSDTELPSVSIPFAYKSFKDNVEYIGPNVLSKDTQVTTAFAPIFKYSLKYENRNDLGYFVFTRGAGADSSSSDAFNPAVLAAPVASQAGAFVAMNQALDYAFEHSDAYMLLPSDKRFLLSNSGRYAISSGEVLRNQPGDFINSSIWVNSYASFENIGLANGPKVSTTSYGTLVGGDSELKYLSHGWQTASTAYMGYNGSNQHFSGISTYQNGGLLGVTQSFYKNNFFTALTATAGATVGEASTMYGHENFTSLMAGIASKSGYNLELRDGKYIIQPSMMMSYTYINTFDYTNAAGVRIDSDPLHTIQLHPDIKFAANLKNGWQPYAKVGMVWNLMNDTKFTANDVRLPELSVKPYVEYGVGIQKRYADKFSGYIQAMIRNGGRNGIALTAGFRWSLGSEGKPIEHCKNIQNVAAKETCNLKNITPATAKTVQTKVTPRTVNTAKTKITPVTTTVQTSPTRKVIKQLSYKPNVNQNSSKSTRTINKGMLKQL